MSHKVIKHVSCGMYFSINATCTLKEKRWQNVDAYEENMPNCDNVDRVSS